MDLRTIGVASTGAHDCVDWCCSRSSPVGLLGLWRGLVFEVLSLLGWVAAFLLAQWLAPRLAPHAADRRRRARR